jgi:HlyD family secretion protein
VFDKKACTRLAQTGAVSERQGKEAVATSANAAAGRQTTDRGDEGSVDNCKANRQCGDPGRIRGDPKADRAAAGGLPAPQRTRHARAELVEARANLQDLTVTAPFTGTVLTRSAEPGEVIQAGTAIVTLLDLTKVYLRGFIPEGRIGRVKIGQAARIYLDSQPDRPIAAYVLRIDPRATFTPENTYFQDDRVKQVVGVKLQLKDAIGFAKPGMPADGEVLVEGDSWPAQRSSK